ncbi:MAG: hypothetical protein A3G34_16380 [Candidatus Lindowbacteria bacterium RIFCSPLOWO2_12_FULL_62_27]|nr:MAG: hypothetical protein A3G34_16380 [Candidatus Lindowbacteria bacterium RIFCSPLOWO2_12_FULL_62_27]
MDFGFWIWNILICFGFRDSDFGFQKLPNSIIPFTTNGTQKFAKNFMVEFAPFASFRVLS